MYKSYTVSKVLVSDSNGLPTDSSVTATQLNLLGLVTTAGTNIFTVPNPSAITFLQVNADNSVSLLSAAAFRTAIGAGTGTGSVTTISVVTNQGVSGSVANPTTTPAITLSLGTLTGITSVNGLVITANTGVITTGTWNASVIGVTYGGTGTTTQFTSGSIVYAGASGVYTQNNAMFFWDNTNSIFYVGANSGAFTNSRAHFQSTVNSYSQINSINKSNGGSASADVVSTADTGTDSINYVNLGINSSGYNDVSYTIGSALDGYLYNNGGHLAVGTQTAAKSIYLHTGGTLLANKRVTIADASITFHAYGAGVLQTDGSGVISSATVPDGSLTTSYIKADGTRALTANWGAGAFSITANSVILGYTTNELAMGSSASQASNIWSTSSATKGIITFDSFFRIDGNNTTIGINNVAVALQPITAVYSTNNFYVNQFKNSSTGAAAGMQLQVENSTGSIKLQKFSTGFTTSGLVTAHMGRISNTTGNILVDTQGSATDIIFATSGNAAGNERLRIKDASLTFADAINIIFNATTGTKIGTATTQKLSFYNSTPIVQPTGDVVTALQNLGLITSATLGVITGVTTNSNAAVGVVGEYIESVIATGSAVALTTATTANITSISLTAGDWDVTISGYFKTTGASASDFELGLSTTSATMDTTAGRFNNNPTVVTGLSGDLSSNVPRYRLSLSGTTTVYFVAQSTFTVGSVSVYGVISARRPR